LGFLFEIATSIGVTMIFTIPYNKKGHPDGWPLA